MVDGDGRRTSGAKIVCARCSRSLVVARPHLKNNAGYSDGKEIAFLTKRYQRAGWLVGRLAMHDRCPDCQKESKAMAGKDTPNLAIVAGPASRQPVETAPVMTAAVPAGTSPRQMSREDRRLVFSRLDEVYLDEERGYGVGWTDQKVADDLGVPRAWVVTIREENFGGAGGNEEIAAQVAEAEALVKRASEAAAECDRRATEIRREAAAIDSMVRTIRKAIGM
ncbi:hypothetical protein [Rhodovulum sp. PH10]|uniref:hypothetical protein n=1 Tax=Rhodovulum sp. PH10 TaxID=1187851 RepID=UPI0012F98477|nr:hypothetical protein [Rhodovulum sp. PH10]